MPHHENSRKTFVAAAPVGEDRLVKLTASGAEVCGAGEMPVGTTEVGAKAAGDHMGVRLLNTPGTVEVMCGAVVALGQMLTTGEGGAVVPHAGSGPVVGMALQAGVSGGVLEMMPFFNHIPSASAVE